MSAEESPALPINCPPTSAVLVPTLNTMLPLFPPTAAPVASVTEPDAPLLVVPDAKVNVPLTPFVPLLTERITTAPEDFAVPAPLSKSIAPPV